MGPGPAGVAHPIRAPFVCWTRAPTPAQTRRPKNRRATRSDPGRTLSPRYTHPARPRAHSRPACANVSAKVLAVAAVPELCTEVVPKSDKNYSCAQQKAFGACTATWMLEGGYCARERASEGLASLHGRGQRGATGMPLAAVCYINSTMPSARIRVIARAAKVCVLPAFTRCTDPSMRALPPTPRNLPRLAPHRHLRPLALRHRHPAAGRPQRRAARLHRHAAARQQVLVR
jgi:hypothetical protein